MHDVTLGYLGNDDWRDMSDYLVHFVGGTLATEEEQFTVLCEVMSSGRLRPSLKRFGFTKGWNAPTAAHRAVCLSEVPLPYLHRLVSRHGKFGVGVTKEYARSLGAQRVWYVDDGVPLMQTLDALVQQATDSGDWNSDIWEVSRFIDRVAPEGGGRPRYEFEWEREWRVHCAVPLEGAVKFLFVPEVWQARALERFGDVVLIDPRWDEARIGSALHKP